MEEYSEDIKIEFEKQFKAMEDNKTASNNKQITLLIIAFAIVFVFILTGTVFSYQNYLKAKNNQNSQTNVIERIVVKEN